MLRWLTAGESHGPSLVAILEGLPAHVQVTTADIQDALARRRLGYGRGARMKFELDEVTLEFTDEAIRAVAVKALERGTGARGARAILEEVLLHVMYDVPSRDDVSKVVVTEEVVNDDVAPTLIPREAEGRKKKSA